MDLFPVKWYSHSMEVIKYIIVDNMYMYIKSLFATNYSKFMVWLKWLFLG